MLGSTRGGGGTGHVGWVLDDGNTHWVRLHWGRGFWRQLHSLGLHGHRGDALGIRVHPLCVMQVFGVVFCRILQSHEISTSWRLSNLLLHLLLPLLLNFRFQLIAFPLLIGRLESRVIILFPRLLSRLHVSSHILLGILIDLLLLLSLLGSLHLVLPLHFLRGSLSLVLFNHGDFSRINLAVVGHI